MSINKQVTVGRLTADPVLSQVGDSQCTSFTIASNTNAKDAAGEYLTTFYRATAWRKQAEICAKYLHKGDLVTAVGDLSIRPYRDKNGQERFSIQLTLSNIDFCGERKRTDTASPQPESDDELPI